MKVAVFMAPFSRMMENRVAVLKTKLLMLSGFTPFCYMKRIILIAGILIATTLSGMAQQERLLVVGNVTSDSELLHKDRQAFADYVTSKPNTRLVLLGDCDLNDPTVVSFFKSLQAKGVSLVYVPGDKDWQANGGSGNESIEHLQKQVKKAFGKRTMQPSSGCPGPVVVEEGEEFLLLAINSQWWLQSGRKQVPIDADCKCITSHQISEKLEGLIEDAGHRQVVVFAHHPIYSSGLYGGGKSLKAHFFPKIHDHPSSKAFLPVYGSFYHLFRQNKGTPQDHNHPLYRDYRQALIKGLEEHENVIIASGHDYNSQLNLVRGNVLINAGAGGATSRVTKTNLLRFASRSTGVVEVTVEQGRTNIAFIGFSGDTTVLYQTNLMRSQSAPKNEGALAKGAMRPDTLMIGGDYHAGLIRRIWFGPLYRSSWSTPTRVPFLDLDTTFGGIEAYSLGGGRQTTSLKFHNHKGQTFVFRSVDKNPAKALPVSWRNTVVERLTKDMTSTQHPYGALIVSDLLDHTTILHARPRLYVLPPSQRLNEWNGRFSYLFGMLEEKPWNPNDGVEGFAGADKIVKTHKMFRKLYSSSKHRIDTTEFLQARMFDLMIGDWGRHEDNWKWAAYVEEDQVRYRPIPRDRDHAFSRWNGILPWLADRRWARPNSENFGKKHSHIQSLTWQNRHYDRYLLSGVSRADFASATGYIQGQLTDQRIEAAIKTLPVEIQETSGEELKQKLIHRKNTLQEAGERYYRLLAKTVDVVGTNKRENFKLVQQKGQLHVEVRSAKTQELIYARPFFKSETGEVNLFGLGAGDAFSISGDQSSGIKVRIVPGEGKDSIHLDEAASSRKITVYDDRLTPGSQKLRLVVSDDPYYIEYNRTKFRYHTYLPIPIISQNVNDGYRIGGGAVYTRHGYDYKKYKVKYRFKISASTENSLLVDAGYEHYLPRSRWKLGTSVNYGNYFAYYNFHGLGNASVRLPELENTGAYRTRFRGLQAEQFATVDLFEGSSFTLAINQDFLEDESTFIVPDSSEETGRVSARNAFGVTQRLELDFRDDASYTTKGVYVRASHMIYSGTDFEDPFGKLSASLAHYTTFRALLSMTLRLEAGLERTYGSNIPYYHLPSLGLSTKLRGYVANRFTGAGTDHFAADLAIHLGKNRSLLLPVYWDINLFADAARIAQDPTDNTLHTGYGVGLSLTPISKDLMTFQANVARSKEESLLFQFGIGRFL